MEKRPRIRVAVAVVHDDKLLLVQHTKARQSYWLLPGGGLEWGEGLKDCVTRELLEETGLVIESGELLFLSETLSPDGTRHVIHLVFGGSWVGGELRVPDDEERITDVRWVGLDEVSQLTLHPPMQSALAKLDVQRSLHSEEERIFLGNLWVD